MTPWRLIVHPAADASWNMAVDEALLDRYAGGTGTRLSPTVRLYAWSPPAVSLGRKQPVPGSLSIPRLRARGIDLVRRPTGGRAVFHEGEWTYAVAGALGAEPFPGGVVETYRRIAGALLEALRILGVDAKAGTGGVDPGPSDPRACFEVVSVHEITLGSAKIVGSAQARRRRAFLQHGSIPLAGHGGRTDAFEEEHGPLSALGTALGGTPEAEAVVSAFEAGFSRRFGVALERAELTCEEELRAAQLRAWKYDSASWTLLGKPGDREGRWGPTVSP